MNPETRITHIEESSKESTPTRLADNDGPRKEVDNACENEGYINSDSFVSQLSTEGKQNSKKNKTDKNSKGAAQSPLEVDIIHTDSGQEGATSLSSSPDKISNNGATGKPLTGKDEVDRASIYSYFMEKDFRYYFQHPYFRLFVAYLVTFCNFLIYAEDPVAHSEKECFIPVVGNCFAFVCTRYPHNAWAFLKVVLWLLAIFIGLLVGKLLIHKLVLSKAFRLHMFADDQGSWMTMFFTSILSLFVISWVYNGFLMIGGDSTQAYRISSLMGIKNSWFMKAAATGTWCGDFFTAWMVTDIMLQEKLYPHWAVGFRKWWVRRYNRIIMFWLVVALTSLVVITVISTDWIQWDRLNKDFLPSNELSRGILASFILVMDLLIVMQDWDFPHFINNMDIKLPGLNTASIKFSIPKCLKREVWVVHISGKWFNYGIIFFVMILDLNMWKNQIFYAPYDYGQYVDSLGKIHSVEDKAFLEMYNETQVSYEYRSTVYNPNTNQTYIQEDDVMNSRYYGFSLGLKSLAFFPSIIAAIFFGCFIYLFGRIKPTPEDPHAGRLQKKKKKSFFARASKRWRDAKIRLMAVRVFSQQETRQTTIPKENNYELVDEIATRK